MRTCASCRCGLGEAFAHSAFCPSCGGPVDAQFAARTGFTAPPPEPQPPLDEVLQLIVQRAAEFAPQADGSAAPNPTGTIPGAGGVDPNAAINATAVFDSKELLKFVEQDRETRENPADENSRTTAIPAAPSAQASSPPPSAKQSTQEEIRKTPNQDQNARTHDDGAPAGRRPDGVWSNTITGSADPKSTIHSGKQLEEAPSLVVNRRTLSAIGDAGASDADYQLLDSIGEGGIGIVYAARQSAVDRTVAVKMLRATHVDSQQRGKFLAEAVITGELDHPNIVPIYDLGADAKGSLFYSMKRVRGTPWNKVIRERSTAENVEILMKVADAVAFAHSRHVVHRDLKPENVMLGDFGEVMLMDWGLALSGVGGRNRAAPNYDPGMGGTPAYMAPEMAVGPIERIDPRSDVYLLGAILFEIVASVPPHTGPNVMACLYAAARNEIVATDKQGELLTIARRALSTERDDRFQSVKDFQAAIREYESHTESIVLAQTAGKNLQDARRSRDYQDFSQALFGYRQAVELWAGNDQAREGIVITEVEYAAAALEKSDVDLALSMLDPAEPRQASMHALAVQAKTERSQRQHRLTAAKRLAVGLTGLVIAVGVGAYLQIRRDRDRAVAAEQSTEIERQAALTAQEQALASAREARAEAARALAAEETARKNLILAGEATQKARLEEGKAIEAAKVAQAARDNESYEAYVARIGLAAAKIEENSFGSAMQLLEACEGERRRWEWGRLVYLCGRQVREFVASAPVDRIAISADGKRVAAAAWDGNAYVWNLDGSGSPVRYRYGSPFVHGVAFSPDGTQVAVCGGDPQAYVQIFDAASGKAVRSFQGHEDGALGVVFSRDGKRLLSCSYDRTARLWDVATGAELKRFEGHNWWVWSAEFAPPPPGEPETRIVTAGQDGIALVWNIETATPSPPFRGHDGPVFAACFSPDGKRVATGGADKRILLWDPDAIEPFDFEALASERTPKPPKFEALEGHTAAVRTVTFSADGLRLASGGHDNTLRVWDVAHKTSLKTVRGHAGWVRSCLFAPDGRRLVSGSHDHRVMLWNPDEYREQHVIGRRVLSGHSDAVLAAAFSPDGAQVVTAGRDHTARLWNSAGESLGEFSEGHAFLASQARFFPPAREADAEGAVDRIVTSGVDNTARIWDVARGVEIARLEPAGRAAAIAVSPDGSRVLTGDDGQGAILWDVRTGKPLVKLPPQGDEVVCVAFSSDGATLLTGEAGGACRLWNAADGGLVRSLDAHRDRITGAAFVADGSRLFTASGDNTVACWDLATGREITDRALRHVAPVTSLAVDAAGRLALTGCGDGKVRLRDLSTARELGVLYEATSSVQVDLSADGSRGLVADAARGAVRVWDLATRQELHPAAKAGQAKAGDPKTAAEPLVDLAARGDLVWSARFAPEGGRILSVGGNGAKLWDLDSGEELQDFAPQGALAAVAFAPDGKHVATGSWDHSIKVWDVATSRAVIKTAGLHGGNINAVDYSPDGLFLASASDDGTCRIFDIAAGRPLEVVFKQPEAALSVRFDSAGKRIVAGCADGAARVWNLSDGKLLAEFRGHTWGVNAAVFSPDGLQVATGSGDNTAAVWDAATGRKLFQLEGHTAGVAGVAFSADGDRLLTGSKDNLAKLWDARKGKEILTLKGHTEEITGVAFSRQGNLALTASRDGTAVLWPAVDWNVAPATGSLAPDAATSDNRGR